MQVQLAQYQIFKEDQQFIPEPLDLDDLIIHDPGQHRLS